MIKLNLFRSISHLEGGVGGHEGNVSNGYLACAGAELVLGHEAVHPAQHLLELVHLVLARLVAPKHHGVHQVPNSLKLYQCFIVSCSAGMRRLDVFAKFSQSILKQFSHLDCHYLLLLGAEKCKNDFPSIGLGERESQLRPAPGTVTGHSQTAEYES